MFLTDRAHRMNSSVTHLWHYQTSKIKVSKVEVDVHMRVYLHMCTFRSGNPSKNRNVLWSWIRDLRRLTRICHQADTKSLSLIDSCTNRDYRDNLKNDAWTPRFCIDVYNDRLRHTPTYEHAKQARTRRNKFHSRVDDNFRRTRSHVLLLESVYTIQRHDSSKQRRAKLNWCLVLASSNQIM